jgi:hypothetical protein
MREFDLLETFSGVDDSQQVESAEDSTRRAQTFHEIEDEIMKLPARQREAFLMRYWEEMDVAETWAAAVSSHGLLRRQIQPCQVLLDYGTVRPLRTSPGPQHVRPTTFPLRHTPIPDSSST